MKLFAVLWYDEESTMNILPERFETLSEARDFAHKLHGNDKHMPIEYFVGCIVHESYVTMVPPVEYSVCKEELK